MQKIMNFFLIILLSLGQAKSEVPEVSSESLRTVISQNRFVLLEFYTEWCQYCQDFSPIYEKASEKLVGQIDNIEVVKIDGDKNKEVTEYFEISSYPTIVLLFEGEPLFYDQDFKLDLLSNWVVETVERQPVEIKTEEALKSIEDNLGTFHIYIARDRMVSADYREVLILAKKLGDIPIFFTNIEAVVEKYSVGKGKFYTIKKSETILYNGEHFMSEYLEKFVRITRIAHLIKFDQRQLSNIFRYKIPIIGLFSDGGDQQMEQWVDSLRSGYESHMIAIKFENSEKENEKMFWEFCGIERMGVCIIEPDQHLRKYIFEGRLERESLSKFISQYLDGNLKPHIKNEEIASKKSGQILVRRKTNKRDRI